MLTIYKTLLRFHLYYADKIYDKPSNDSVKEKLERNHYSAAIIITRGIKIFLGECLYKEPGLESLSDKRWSLKPVLFFKVTKGLAPSYLQSYTFHDNEKTGNARSSSRNQIKTFVT